MPFCAHLRGYTVQKGHTPDARTTVQNRRLIRRHSSARVEPESPGRPGGHATGTDDMTPHSRLCPELRSAGVDPERTIEPIATGRSNRENGRSLDLGPPYLGSLRMHAPNGCLSKTVLPACQSTPAIRRRQSRAGRISLRNATSRSRRRPRPQQPTNVASAPAFP